MTNKVEMIIKEYVEPVALNSETSIEFMTVSDILEEMEK